MLLILARRSLHTLIHPTIQTHHPANNDSEYCYLLISCGRNFNTCNKRDLQQSCSSYEVSSHTLDWQRSGPKNKLYELDGSSIVLTEQLETPASVLVQSSLELYLEKVAFMKRWGGSLTCVHRQPYRG